LPAGIEIVAPVQFLERRRVFRASVLFIHEVDIGPIEDFLPAESVCHDEDNALGFVGGGRRRLGSEKSSGACNKTVKKEASVQNLLPWSPRVLHKKRE
jgi:hypothetical protein